MTLDPNEQGIEERIALVAADGTVRGLASAIHFHNTPPWRADEVASQLARCAPSGEWTADGPPVAVFFEGYRNHHDVALGLLERAGVRAWFVIPTDFLDVPVAEQGDYARSRDLGLVEEEGRHALTWDELRAIARRGHGIASHTASHATLAECRDDADFERELAGSRARLEAELAVDVRMICWRYGAGLGDNPRADEKMRSAGYASVLASGQLQAIA